MKTNPLITVYITNHNYGRYLKQSLDSVLSQSFKEFELLIIDDGSTDNSRNIIEEYRDHPKISIIYQSNKGLNITNNIAVRAAKGKYLIRLDADDYLHKHALKLMFNKLESDNLLGLVFPDFYYIDENDKITGRERRHNFEKEVSLYDQPAHGACTMIRLEFLRILGGYNESFICQDGYDLWLKFIMHYKVANINQPLFYYRRHGNNLTFDERLIFNTRKKIKESFIETNLLKTPLTTAIIPVRSNFIGQYNWPFLKLNGQTILERKVNTALDSKTISNIVITSAEKEVTAYAKDKFSKQKRVLFIARPKEYANINESLKKTYEIVIDTLEERNIMPEAIMALSLDFPFLKPDSMDEAVHTLVIFKTDTILSVRPDNYTYYQHKGHSLVPILDQDKFTKLEREALYKGAGGIVLSKVDSFFKHGKIISGKIGHTIVDQKTAFGVFSELDLSIYKYLLQNEIE